MTIWHVVIVVNSLTLLVLSLALLLVWIRMQVYERTLFPKPLSQDDYEELVEQL